MKKLTFIFIILPFTAFAGPKGFQVIHGQATKEVRDSVTTIKSSDKAIIHWDDFSIASHETVHFSLQNPQSEVLNRVVGMSPSQLLGRLESNGKVILVNPHGVLIGKEGFIHTAGFIASTANILDQDFLKETLQFTEGGSGAITNLGTIQSSSGDVVLFARSVHNQGTIETPNGLTSLATGTELLIKPDGEERIFVKLEGEELTHQGIIEALNIELKSGSPYSKAIQTKGIVRATKVREEGGKIFLYAEKGTAQVESALTASGGEIQVLGKDVIVSKEATLDVSHPTHPGKIAIGGDFQGNSLFPSEETNVAGTLKADNLVQGDGGQIVIWSNGSTTFTGHITVQAVEGNGGHVEVSGNTLTAPGTITCKSLHGNDGHLLYDPGSVTISNAANAPPNVFNDAALSTSLGSANVTINTASATNGAAQVMTVASTAHVNWSSSNKLTLIADQRIIVNTGASITCTGSGSLEMQGNGNGGSGHGIQVSGTLSTNSGNIVLTGTGVGSGNSGIRIQSGGSVTTQTGTLSWQGFAGTGNQRAGIWVDTGSTVNCNQGTIDWYGEGRTGSGLVKPGVGVYGVISSDTGLIKIVGLGGNGASEQSSGIEIGTVSAGTIQTNTGTIELHGQGGTSSNRRMWGVYVAPAGTIKALGNGNVILDAQGGNNTILDSTAIADVDGIRLEGTISTVQGNIFVDSKGGIAVGGGNGSGMIIVNGLISSGGGNITMNLVGGQSLTNRATGLIMISNGRIRSLGGDISITGVAGGGAINVQGIYVVSPASIDSAGGTLTLHGTGGAVIGIGTGLGFSGIQIESPVTSGGGPAFITGIATNTTTNHVSHGVVVTGANGKLTSGAGDMTIVGTGANGANNKSGIHIESGALVSSTSGTLALTGNASGIGNRGIHITGSTLTTATGTFNVTGTATGTGNNNQGIFFNNNAIISQTGVGAGTSTFQGIGSPNGTDSNQGIYITGSGTQVLASFGATNFSGTGGGTGNLNGGIRVDLGATVAGSNDASISTTGTGANGTNNSEGVAILSGASVSTVSGGLTFNGDASGTGNSGVHISDLGSTVTTDTGTISATGTASGTGSSNQGILIENDAIVSQTGVGAGTSTFQGTGSPNGTNSNQGIYITGSGTQVLASFGATNFSGTGGGTGNLNGGIRVDLGATVAGFNDASISMTGTGANGTNNSEGVAILSGASVSTVSGGLTFNGDASGTGNSGVHISDLGSTVTTDTGTISAAGTASGTGNDNQGILIENSAIVSQIGAGTSTFQGTGSPNGTNSNQGIYVTGSGTQVLLSEATNFTGIASGTGNDNQGILIENDAIVSQTEVGAGTSTFQGTGSPNGTDRNQGIYITGSGTEVFVSLSGLTDFTGTGGGTGTLNGGIRVDLGATVAGFNDASISMTGTGANGTNNSEGVAILSGASVSTVSGGLTFNGDASGTGNSGVHISDLGSTVTTDTGTISATGIASGTGSSNQGIFIENDAIVSQTGVGAGTSTFQGTGSPNGTDSNQGIYITGSGTEVLVSLSGLTDFTGTGGGTGTLNGGIRVDLGATVAGSNDASISMTGTGANGTNDSEGVAILSGASVSTVSGALTFNGDALGTGNSGVHISDLGSTVTTDTGTISVTGTASGTGNDNQGILIENSAIVSQTGVGAGTSTFQGTGSPNGTDSNQGIYITGSGTQVFVSLSGLTDFTGTGGGTGTLNGGIRVDLGATVTGSNNASISMTGTGANGTNNSEGVAILSGASVSTVSGALTFNGDALGTGNSGVHISDLGSTVTTDTGTISVTGTASGTGNDNQGILIENSAIVSQTGVGAGTSTFQGTGSPNGTDSNQGIYITGSGTEVLVSLSGLTDFTGTGGGTGTLNGGIRVDLGATVAGSNDASISMTGTGANGTNNSEGVAILSGASVSTVSGPLTFNGDASGTGNSGVHISDLGSTVTTATGTFNVTGTASGTGNDNQGILIENDAIVSQTGVGAGTSTFQGTGSPNGTDSNQGIYITGSGTEVLVSLSGLTDFTGTGGGTGTLNGGIRVDLGATVAGSNDASISMTGTGANGTNNSEGVAILSGASVSTVSGPLTFAGNASGTGNSGVHISDLGSTVTTATGTFNVTGTASGTGNNNQGILIENDAIVSQTGVGAGTSTFQGTGSPNGTDSNQGIYITGSGTEVLVSLSGLTDFTGTGGGTGTLNGGIRVDLGATVAGSNDASISMTGTGANGTNNSEGVAILSGASVSTVSGPLTFAGNASGAGNSGVHISDLGSTVTTNTGTMNGTGTSLGTGNNNQGILIENSAIISRTGAGTGTFRGTGSPNGTDSNQGIYITGSGTQALASGGTMNFIGTGKGTGILNEGIRVDLGAVIAASNAASITLDGAAQPATAGNYGVRLTDTGTAFLSSGSGTLTIIGRDPSPKGEGVWIDNGARVTGTTNTTIIGQTFSDFILGPNGIITSPGTLNMSISGNLILQGGGLLEPARIDLPSGTATISTLNDVQLLSGTTSTSSAQIGSSGTLASGSVDFSVGGKLLINTQVSNSYALIGHGDPTAALSTLSGNITGSVGANIILNGANAGGGSLGFAQIGHVDQGGLASTISGDILLTANNWFVNGGSAGTTSYARVGHGGRSLLTTVGSGSMQLIANIDWTATSVAGGGRAQVVNLGTGPLILVVDNAFPTPFDKGPGSITFNGLLSANGELRIYTVSPSQNTFFSPINGVNFVSGAPFGVDTLTEQWETYFPLGTYEGGPFEIYYKAGFVPIYFQTVYQGFVATSQLSGILRLVELYDLLNSRTLSYHGSICRRFCCGDEDRLEEYCAPEFDPYQSFIFESTLFWIPSLRPPLGKNNN